MGFFRFRRSLKIFPGVRWNIGKKSSSLSFGVRGAHYTVGTAGRRTTVGIPGTGLSYADIHRSHARVAKKQAGIPAPSSSWIRDNQITVTIHTPDRQPDEAPMRQDQIDALKSINSDFDFSQVINFGEHQAASLIEQMRVQANEVSKTLLKRFYAENGHAVPDEFIDQAYEHPVETGNPPKPWGCLSTFIAVVAIAFFISLVIALLK